MAYSGSGSGTSSSPYIITTADQLNEIRDYTSAYWELGNDIDLDTSPYNTGTGWVPIPTFTGNLNGKGYNVDNLFIDDDTSDDLAFINYLNGGVIRNITFTNVDITGADDIAGLCVDVLDSFIINCSVSGSITGDTNVSGFVGKLRRIIASVCSINKCFSAGTVTGTTNVAGFILSINLSDVLNCYSTAACTGSVVSGFVAFDSPTGFCYSTGAITGTNTAGFQLYSGNYVTTCYWDVTTSGQTWSAGGYGRTTAQMKREDNYVDWSFGNIWTITEDTTYPTLLWQPFTITTREVGITPLDLTTSSAKINAKFSDYDIDPTITESGFVWGLTSLDNPIDIAPASSDYDNYNTDSGTSSSWSKTLTSLPEGQTYFYRGYAKNTDGIYCYGDELSFTTLISDSSIQYKNDTTDQFGLTKPAIQIIFN